MWHFVFYTVICKKLDLLAEGPIFFNCFVGASRPFCCPGSGPATDWPLGILAQQASQVLACLVRQEPLASAHSFKAVGPGQGGGGAFYTFQAPWPGTLKLLSQQGYSVSLGSGCHLFRAIGLKCVDSKWAAGPTAGWHAFLLATRGLKASVLPSGSFLISRNFL